MFPDASNAKLPDARFYLSAIPGSDPSGAADSAAAIQAAINALPAEGGTVVLAQPGTYKITTTLTLKSNTSFSCAPGVTITMDGPNWVQNYQYQPLHSAIQNFNFLVPTIIDENISVSGCRFTQNFAAPFNVHFISFKNARNVRVSGNYFLATGAGDGVSFRGSDNVTTDNNYMYGAANTCWDHWEGSTNIKVVNNTCIDAHTVGSYITGTGSSFVGNGSISATTMTITSVGHGYLLVGHAIVGTGVAAGTVVTAIGTGTQANPVGTYTVSPSQTVGPIAITGAGTDQVSSGGMIRGNVFHIPVDGVAAIALNGKARPGSGATNIVVSDNYITGNGVAHNTAIVIEDPGLNNVIANNIIVNSGADAGAAIIEQTGNGGIPGKNIITGNVISGWNVGTPSVAAISTVGTGSLISNNSILGGTYPACIRLYGSNQIASNNVCDSGTAARVSIIAATTPIVIDLNPATATVDYSLSGTLPKFDASIDTQWMTSTSQLDVTNSNVLAAVPGLSIPVVTGKTYYCSGHLSVSSTIGGGIKMRFVNAAGMTNPTSMRMTAVTWDGTTLLSRLVGASISDLLTDVQLVATDIYLEGAIEVETGGILSLQASQRTIDAASTTSVLKHSTLQCHRKN